MVVQSQETDHGVDGWGNDRPILYSPSTVISSHLEKSLPNPHSETQPSEPNAVSTRPGGTILKSSETLSPSIKSDIEESLEFFVDESDRTDRTRRLNSTRYPFFEDTQPQADIYRTVQNISSYRARFPFSALDDQLFSRTDDSVNPFLSGEFTQTPCIQVRNLYKSFYTRHLCRSIEVKVLQGLNMTVMKRSIFGLLGPSGCGKTTLIECIMGRANYSSGIVKVFGCNPGSRSSGIPGKSVGFMPQDYTLYPDLTIVENCTYFASLLGMTKRETKERIKILLPFLQLPEDKRLVRNLSGGQKRRTSFMIAILHDPPLLILDEPTVGVDPDLRKNMWNYMKDLTILKHTTVLVTTHYIEECRQADRVGMMSGGVLLLEEHPITLMEKYNNISLEDIFLKLCLEQLGDDDDDGRSVKKSKRYERKTTTQRGTTSSDDTASKSVKKPPPYRSFEALSKKSNEDSSKSTNNLRFKSVNDAADKSVNNEPGKSKDARWNSSESSGKKSNKNITDNLSQRTYTGTSNGNVKSINDVPEAELPRDSFKNDPRQSKKPSSIPIQKPVHKSSQYFTNKASVLEHLKSGRRGSDPIPRTDGVLNCRRLKAIVIKNIIKLLRNPTLVLFELINPALQTVVFCLTMGVDPHHLQVGKISEDQGNTINFQTVNLGAGFFKHVDKYYIDLKQRTSIQKITDETHEGNSWGYVLVPENFTKLTIGKMMNPLNPIPAFNSNIHVHLDMTSSVVDYVIYRTLREAQLDSFREVLQSVSLNPNMANESLQFEKPIYGTNRGEFKEFMISGVILMTTYFISVSITSTQVIMEKVMGLSERSYIAGMSIMEMIIGLVLTQVVIICSQAALMMIVAFVLFRIKVEGMYLLVFLFALIEGLSGMCFGLVIAGLSNKAEDGLTLAEGSYFPNIMMSGTLWPLEAQPNWFRYTAYCTNPQLFPIMGLYGVITRGWGITNWQVYCGFLAGIGWTLLYIALAALILKLRSKK